MLQILDAHTAIFKSWRVLTYEQEGDTYMLAISARLQDDSQLELRDYLFADGTRKYGYHWMEPDGILRRRWDNAPHWPEVSTEPHHVHMPGQSTPEASIITNLEDLFDYLQDWLAQTLKTEE
jgi:hypothetical protein